MGICLMESLCALVSTLSSRGKPDSGGRSVLAILPITKFLLSRARSGLSVGLYLVGLFIIPMSIALSSTVSSEGSFAKNVSEAARIPNALLPKKMELRYISIISSFV